MKQKDLTGKVVCITGGSAGLGEQIAYQAAKAGAVVIVCARRLHEIERVKNNCQILSNQAAFAYELDVAEPMQIKAVVETIKNEVGTIDILVNNAGFGHFENAVDFDMDLAEKMFRVNVLGLMYMCQLVALEMLDQKTGHIINIASQAGKMATQKSAIYSATKFAVLGYSNALRLELKPAGIHVTTVNPGPISTNFFEIADQSGDYLSKVDMIVLNPEKVAEKIVRIMGTSKRELNLPKLMEAASKMYQLFPHIGDFLASSLFNKK
ncbi:SDR family NAD(P)-dependent oxidoreductase [Isobaculum melis]|uniref:Short-chain dehydrogenase n=1 Tax=Isobaculum melis TaxID=142588 RepID=A0A1H9RQQ1_9LACT|nr:SDR family oxidoreductase [Isobaculum melis]SER75291.1 hypothetical protein SAMN04488559_10520 [Isobaculum melis]